jgi:hypothetical protein
LTLLVLVILAALWAAVLLPPLLRSRTSRTNDSIGDFNYRLDALGRTNGTVVTAAPPVPRPEQAARRRRDVLRGLLIAVGVTGLLALATQMALLWALFGLAFVALLAFLGLWAWSRSVQAEQLVKVRRIRPRPAHTRDLPLRRAASS